MMNAYNITPKITGDDMHIICDLYEQLHGMQLAGHRGIVSHRVELAVGKVDILVDLNHVISGSHEVKDLVEKGRWILPL